MDVLQILQIVVDLFWGGGGAKVYFIGLLVTLVKVINIFLNKFGKLSLL